ncbi:MAG: hypothetical protein ACRDJ1_09900 [Actinomycetota bacterium]
MTDLALLDQEFDLRYRPQPGDRSHYRLTIVYQPLTSLGARVHREEWAGDFERLVEAVDGQRVTETITWRHFSRRFADGDEEYGEAESFPWAEGLAYKFSAEDSYADFHWGYDHFPRDLMGFNAMLLTIDAHFEFDFLRSSHHGAIESLRRIGDRVVVPDTGTPFEIRFDPLIVTPGFNKQNLRTGFEGISQVDGEPTAIVSFDMDPSPFTMMLMENELSQSSTFNGILTIRLSDGALERGSFCEYVFNSGGCINAVYELTRIDEARYASGA